MSLYKSQTNTPQLTDISLHAQSRQLELVFGNGESFLLPLEFMRVYSPSAEVQGHGPGQEVLQTGKRDIQIFEIESVGNYGIKPVFSDGHDSGIFSFTYLYFLASQQDKLWAEYEKRLQQAGVSRDDPMPLNTHGACGHQH